MYTRAQGVGPTEHVQSPDDVGPWLRCRVEDQSGTAGVHAEWGDSIYELIHSGAKPCLEGTGTRNCPCAVRVRDRGNDCRGKWGELMQTCERRAATACNNGGEGGGRRAEHKAMQVLS